MKAEYFFVALALWGALTIWAVIADSNEWEEFRNAHHCKIVSMESSSTALGVSGSGNAVVMSVPGKTGWLCDDGITYYR